MTRFGTCMVWALASMGASDTVFAADTIKPDSWDFTLPTLEGRRFVRAADIKGPVLVNFWGKECAPCIEELPRLQAFAHSNPEWTVLLVATDPPQDAMIFLKDRGIALDSLRSGVSAAGLMTRAGNPIGALPYTVGMRNTRLCYRKLGALQESDLQDVELSCSTTAD